MSLYPVEEDASAAFQFECITRHVWPTWAIVQAALIEVPALWGDPVRRSGWIVE